MHLKFCFSSWCFLPSSVCYVPFLIVTSFSRLTIFHLVTAACKIHISFSKWNVKNEWGKNAKYVTLYLQINNFSPLHLSLCLSLPPSVVRITFTCIMVFPLVLFTHFLLRRCAQHTDTLIHFLHFYANGPLLTLFAH